MELIKVEEGQIVTAGGQPIRLRGWNIGGWLNLEDFIDGFVGAEHNLRATMARVLGKGKAHFFFERLLDHFFTEDDVAGDGCHGRQCAAHPVQLPALRAR